jgi:hypothetical protein
MYINVHEKCTKNILCKHIYLKDIGINWGLIIGW